jgi:hypothetical protein
VIRSLITALSLYSSSDTAISACARYCALHNFKLLLSDLCSKLVSLYLLVTLLSYSNTHQPTLFHPYLPHAALIATSDENFQLQADLSDMKPFSNKKPSPRPLQHDNNHRFQSVHLSQACRVGQIKAGIVLCNMVESFPIIQ